MFCHVSIKNRLCAKKLTFDCSQIMFYWKQHFGEREPMHASIIHDINSVVLKRSELTLYFKSRNFTIGKSIDFHTVDLQRSESIVINVA